MDGMFSKRRCLPLVIVKWSQREETLSREEVTERFEGSPPRDAWQRQDKGDSNDENRDDETTRRGSDIRTSSERHATSLERHTHNNTSHWQSPSMYRRELVVCSSWVLRDERRYHQRNDMSREEENTQQKPVTKFMLAIVSLPSVTTIVTTIVTAWQMYLKESSRHVSRNGWNFDSSFLWVHLYLGFCRKDSPRRGCILCKRPKVNLGRQRERERERENLRMGKDSLLFWSRLIAVDSCDFGRRFLVERRIERPNLRLPLVFAVLSVFTRVLLRVSSISFSC